MPKRLRPVRSRENTPSRSRTRGIRPGTTVPRASSTSEPASGRDAEAQRVAGRGVAPGHPVQARDVEAGQPHGRHQQRDDRGDRAAGSAGRPPSARRGRPRSPGRRSGARRRPRGDDGRRQRDRQDLPRVLCGPPRSRVSVVIGDPIFIDSGCDPIGGLTYAQSSVAVQAVAAHALTQAANVLRTTHGKSVPTDADTRRRARRWRGPRRRRDGARRSRAANRRRGVRREAADRQHRRRERAHVAPEALLARARRGRRRSSAAGSRRCSSPRDRRLRRGGAPRAAARARRAR